MPCLRSIEGLDYEGRRVLVVDNGSTDDSVERIRAAHPDVPILEVGTNLGFATANNIGIRYALELGAEYVWILNNDTVVEPGALSAMVAEAERDPRVGVVGSVQFHYHDPDAVQSWGGGRVNRWTAVTTLLTEPGRCDYISGASMLVKARVFEDIGLFDERYFFYWEDVDFSQRALGNGWKLKVAETARIVHRCGASMNQGSANRSGSGDRAHAQSSGIYVGQHGGTHLRFIVPLRLGGMVLNRLRRRQLRNIPVLVGEFVQGVRIGRADSTIDRDHSWTSSG